MTQMNKDPIIIDVREKDEFSCERIKDSINLPLSEFESHGQGLLKNFQGQALLLMCQSGKRAAMAAQQMEQMKAILDTPLSTEVYLGGINEWKKQGKPIEKGLKARIPLFRQVLIGAGSLILISLLLAFFFHPNFLFVTAFVGLGQIFAGATGFCPMAIALGKMPWNKTCSI